MIDDPFCDSVNNLVSPAQECFSITPTDSAELPRATKALFIGVGGDVTLVPLSGTAAVTFRNLPAGSILDVRVRAVRATGTTASALVGMA